MTRLERTINGNLFVGSIEHSVKCVVKSSELNIEVQNMKTGEMWKSSFTCDYIENITTKTGSYKQYSTFVDMLCNAATQTDSDSVELELLTYSDLIELKTGKLSNKRSSDNKRYLILIYKVRYDTVHYPLPLQYAGKMGTAELQQNVTKLQKEIDRLKEQIVSVPSSPANPVLHRSCCEENAALKREIASLRQSNKDEASPPPKTVRSLQNSLRNLENDMIREKNKYQRALDKKNQECRRLVEEVEKLRVENRTVTVKLRNVTTELNISKRANASRLSNYSNRSTPGSHSRLSGTRPRSAPLHSNFRTGRGDQRARSTSIDRSTSRDRARRSNSREYIVSSGSRGSYNSSRNSSKERSKPPSRDRVDNVYSRKRSTSRTSNRSDSEIRTRARTPSPAGARFPRFDPSAYVKDKQQKLQDKRRMRDREVHSRTYQPRARSTPLERASPSSSIYHKPPTSNVVKEIIANNILNHRRRSGSVSSLDSYQSNRSNRSNGSNRATANSRNNNRPKKKQRSKYSYPSSCSDSDYQNKENSSRARRNPYLNSSPSVDLSLNKSNLSFTKDSEIAEIDARLNALQTYLKDAKNKQYVT